MNPSELLAHPVPFVRRRVSTRRVRAGAVLASLVLFGFVPSSVAQTATAPARPTAAATAPTQAAPTAPAKAVQAAPAPGQATVPGVAATLPSLALDAPIAPAEPPKLDIQDDMLVPAARAPRTLGSFQEALSFIAARSTDLGKAEAEIRRAEAGTRSALAALLPQINGQATATHQFITKDVSSPLPDGTVRTSVVPQTDYINGSITLVQPLINAQSWYALGTARRNEQLATANRSALRRVVTSGVASAIVGVVAAERVAELNRLGLRSALERQLLTSKKRELGAANALDTVRADQDVASARAAVVSGDESLRQAREALGLALGVSGQVGVAEGLALNGLLEEAQRACPAGSDVQARQDFIAANKQLEIAQRNLRSVELSFLPTLNAQTTLASTTADVSTSPRTTWNVQAVLSVPIWDGGARYGALRSARALRDEASFDLEAKKRSIEIELAQAGRGVRVAEDALAVAHQTEKLAVDADKLTQLGFRVGQSTSFELVAAAAAVRQAEINLVLREFDLVNAKVKALLVIGQCAE